ncbi:hypothetical protein VPH35_009527 [Triticum aestivum]
MRGSRSRRRRSVGNVYEGTWTHSPLSLLCITTILRVRRNFFEITTFPNTWFAKERDLKEAAGMAFRRLTEAEDWRLTPTGEPVGALRMLLWAMEKSESDDPKQEMKWRAFRSRHRKPAGPTEFVIGAMMGMVVPAPTTVEEKASEDPVEKKARWPMVIRRSPCFPRWSRRLLSLACRVRE